MILCKFNVNKEQKKANKKESERVKNENNNLQNSCTSSNNSKLNERLHTLQSVHESLMFSDSFYTNANSFYKWRCIATAVGCSPSHYPTHCNYLVILKKKLHQTQKRVLPKRTNGMDGGKSKALMAK